MAFIIYANPHGDEELGSALFIFSLLAPTAAAAMYFSHLASLLYAFFEASTEAYLALAGIVFLALGLFAKLGLCEEEVGGATGCVTMAFGAATVGSFLIFWTVVAGALAVGYAAPTTLQRLYSTGLPSRLGIPGWPLA